jgi:hypothetical protein
MMKVIVSSIEELEQLIMELLNYGVPTTSIVLSHTVDGHEFNLEPQKMTPQTEPMINYVVAGGTDYGCPDLCQTK